MNKTPLRIKRVIIEKLGMTIYAVANQLSIPEASLRQAVNGRRSLSDERRRAVNRFMVKHGAFNSRLWNHEPAAKGKPTRPAAAPAALTWNEINQRIQAMKGRMMDEQILEHFGLCHDPFVDDFDSAADLFVDWPGFKAAKKFILKTVNEQLFSALFGAPGGGKTTLARWLVEWSDDPRNKTVLIDFCHCEPAMMQPHQIIAKAIRKLRPDTSLATGRVEQLDHLRTKLTELRRKGMRPVFMIDNAHELKPKTIESLKLLWDMRDGFRCLLSILLIGQTGVGGKTMETKLGIDELQSASLRIKEHRMKRLGGKTKDYIEWRFRRAGVSRQIVQTAVYKRLAAMDADVPLRAAGLIGAAMVAAYDDGANVVTADHLEFTLGDKATEHAKPARAMKQTRPRMAG